jgi:1,4-dihydroxy-2-naphthoate polyprenyltransferase
MSEIRNTVKLLRFPFSVFLLPISLFSLFYIHPVFNYELVLVLLIWHLLVFPSSNGYNSYHDKDEGPIGGLAAPPKPTKFLLYVSNTMDAAAILLSFIVNAYFVCFVALYIIASRLYSNRKIRLKKHPILGFLVVFIFQGAWIFCANVFGLSSIGLFSHLSVIFSILASSFLIATIYPITQIYQHAADKNDGVKTLSMVLGVRGTFLFSTCMFIIATVLIYFSFNYSDTLQHFWLFISVMLPSTLFFLVWTIRSFKNTAHVNFKNAMIMLVMSSLLNNIYFFILLFK